MKDNPCKNCSKCCEYLAVEIDKPESKKDFDNVIWFVLHKNVQVYIGLDNHWYIEFKSKCKELNPKGWCKQYEQRPKICRKYSAKNCEKDDVGWKQVFGTRGQIEGYMQQKGIA